ncbi:uncharacterized protein LOC120328857 isoform X1 [Styela clava]
MDSSNKSSQKGLQSKKSDKEKEKTPAVGCEVDFIADGVNEKPQKNTKSKKIKTKSSMKWSSGNKDKKKSGRSKSTTSNDSKVETATELWKSILLCTDEYIDQKNDAMTQLKKDGSMTPKHIEEIRKLEILIRSIKFYKDFLSAATQNIGTEDDVYVEDSPMFGQLRLGIAGMKECTKLKNGDHCEALLMYDNKKNRFKGQVISENEVNWNPKEIVLNLNNCDAIAIKIMEPGIFGKLSNIGNATIDVINLISSENRMFEVTLDKEQKMKLDISHVWIPFNFNMIPTKYLVKSDNNDNTEAKTLDESIENEEIENLSIQDTTFDDYESSETTHDTSIMRENAKLEEIFLERMHENAKHVMMLSKDPENTENLETEVNGNEETDKNVWAEALCRCMVLNCSLDDHRGRYTELQLLETMVLEILENLKNCCNPNERYIFDELLFYIQSQNQLDGIFESDELDPKYVLSKFAVIQFKDEQEIAYRAISSHLKYIIEYLKDVGSYGYLNIKEVIAVHKLNRQGKILKQILDVGCNPDMQLEDFPDLVKRRTLLELWRSCCDGETELCVSSKILCLEFESEFGREVKRKHPDVVNKIFSELVRRIIGLNIQNTDDYSVTIFQLLLYSEEMSTEGEIEDFAKTVDKLALEMFITSTLRSDNTDLILIAIKKVGTLLALRTSNLCALSHLLLSPEKMVRAAAAAHIMHIGKDVSLRDKALVSYAELLESNIKRDRQSSCIALGFLGGKECIPQLMQLYHCDIDADVTEAAAHALTSIGEEGKLALEHASSTLLAQTMIRKNTVKIAMRLGTAL